MYAQELFIHDSSQWQRAEGLHACFINIFRVFVLTLELKGEVVGQVPAFVITPE